MLSRRATFVLGALTLLLGAWTCWAVAPAGMVPAVLAGDAALSAHMVAGFALALAAIGAPLIFSKEELANDSRLLGMAKSALSALWLSVTAGFMMLAAARVSAVGDLGIAQAALWIFFVAWFSIELSRLMPRAAAGVLFFWIVALPVCAYMFAELFLSSPAGSAGLTDSAAPQARALSAVLYWMLSLSPGTATLGALTGKLADGSPYSFPVAIVWMAALALPILARGLGKAPVPLVASKN
jgi:hypothetical protein